MEGQAKTEADLIRRYRDCITSKCDMAIEDIVNEAIVVSNELKDAVKLNLENVSFGREIRRKIEDEFNSIKNNTI